MRIADIVSFLESIASTQLQESYDNAGLLTGQREWNCTGVLCTLDATEEVIEEAIKSKVNLVVAHHPIIFSGLKRITGSNYVERTIIKAIKNDIAIYAIHTNLDNVIHGVSGRMADRLGLINRSVLLPRPSVVKKLVTYVPDAALEAVRSALFVAGAGQIGNYSECSFSGAGKGTFKAGENTNPYVGEQGQRHEEAEYRLEMVFPASSTSTIVRALKSAHPYEEVAYDLIDLGNTHPSIGSGLIGDLSEPMNAGEFLRQLRQVFQTDLVRHTPIPGREIKKVALCGGAGSFLITKALAAGADAYVTADVKYHEFFNAEGRMLLCDIGHYESEQFTVDLLHDILHQKFPTFALLKSGVKTNPVNYFRD